METPKQVWIPLSTSFGFLLARNSQCNEMFADHPIVSV